MTQPSLKPQDVYVLAKLIVHRRSQPSLKQMTLAQDLGLSSSEVGKSIKRLKQSQLIDSESRPIYKNVSDFLVYGFKFVFPAQVGGLTRGYATAHAAAPLSRHVKYSIEDIYVWPAADGDTRGQMLTPLYPSVGNACQKDSELYEVMALLDALRVGRLREIQIAKDELRKRIKG